MSVRRTLLAVAIWGLTLGAFVFYLAEFERFEQTYGGGGAAIVSLLWLALLATLYFTTPAPGVGALGAAGAVASSPGEDELVRVVRAALADETAHREMTNALAVGAAPGSLRTGLECDLNDWGFAYGVAWAVARERHPADSESDVAERALEATRTVFDEYCAGEDWSGRLEDRRAPAGLGAAR